MSDRFFRWIATGFGSGYAPIAPGTWGTVVGLLWAWCCAPLSAGLYALTTAAAIGVATFSAAHAAVHFGSDDPPQVVIDEVVAMLIVMAGVPWTWKTVLVGFLAFRLFDIWKPWPVDLAERLPGGLGIVADDLVAAGYAWGVLHLLLWITGRG